jgi:hypothetical protein
MSQITLSTTLAARIRSMRFEQVRLDFSFNSAFGSQGVEVSPPLWGCQITTDQMYEADSGEWKALLLLLRGQTNQLLLWDIARPAPIGTMRGTLVLNGGHAQGAVTLSIVDATQAGTTLKAGDWLGIGTATQQLVMVTADATANGSGVISVTVEPPLRAAHLTGATVTWDKPKAYFRRKNVPAGWNYQETFASDFMLDLIEDTRA